jgi:tetratricopeptide (TPR) repeat protein
MNKKYRFLIVIFLIVASFIAYGRILGNGFVDYDDDKYITENNYIQSGINPESIKWAFTAIVCSNWHPLTLLSHALDWSLFGASASGHHLINLLLHIGSVLFLFFFLNRTTKNLWSAAFAAALFALHPLRVESVAWAAERKDVLSMFFGMASIYAYVLYTEKSKLFQYFLCLTLFALSLMSKPMLVTLPFVLLLLDYWPLERWTKEISAPVKSRSHLLGRLLWEKTPFILLTIISSIVTLWAQNKGGAIASMEYLPFSERISNAVISYVSYLGKIFWPVDLTVFYPYEHSFPLWQILVSCFVLIGITLVVIYTIKKTPFLFVGWFWYLGTLIPVIGLVQVGSQSMADRYTYLPSIGIAIMLAWSLPLLFPREGMRKKILFPAGIAALAILVVLTWRQCGYWKNSIELFNHTLQVTKDNDLAQSNLASALLDEGKIDQAVFHYRAAVQIKPNDYIFHYNLAKALYEQAKIEEAIVHYRETLRINPSFVGAHNNLAVILYGQNKYDESIYHIRQALQIKPDDPSYHYNMGFVLSKKGELKEAIEHFRQAIYLKPDYEKAQQELRLALEKEQQQKH